MAEATNTNPLLRLKEQVTCCVCLEVYKQPKSLTCQHAFCLECIDQLPVDIVDGQYKIKCSSCRKTTTLSKDGSTADLLSAFHINTMIELYEMSATFPVNPVAEEKISTYTKCPKHDRDMEMFCDKCQQIVCAVCAVREHGSHTCDLVTVAFPKNKHEIEIYLSELLRQLGIVLPARVYLDVLKKDINQQAEKIQIEVDGFVKKLVEVFQQSGRQLKMDIDTLAQPKLAEIAKQKKEVDNLLDQLKNLEGITLDSKTHEEVLKKKESTMAVCQKVSVQKPPCFIFIPKEDLVMKCTSIGKVVSVGLPVKEAVATEAARCSGGGSVVGMVGVKRMFELKFPSTTHQQISCFLYNNEKNESVTCSCVYIEKAANSSEYKVTYTPTHSGLHYIIVRDGDVDIPCNPRSISILPPPFGREVEVSEELIVPRGIAISKDDLMVCSEVFNNTIAVVKEGQVVKRFGDRGNEEGQLLYPTGVAFTPDNHIVVADTNNHRIQKFTMDGECVGCVGSKGSGKLQFMRIYDVALDSKGRVYVSDKGSKHIQVLLPDLSFSHMIGEGILRDPRGIAIDSQDVLYVCDCDCNTVHKISSDRKNFDQLRAVNRPFIKPTCIAVDTCDMVYVVDVEENTVTVFDCNGDSIGSYVPSSMPNGIAIDSKGNIFHTVLQ